MARKPITAALLAKAQDGDREAAGEVCARMEGAIKSVAVAFAKQYAALDLDDLIQEGYLAVLRALKRYDPSIGRARFSSYAVEAVFNIFRRRALQERRRTAREAATDPDDMADVPGRVWPATPIDPEDIKRLPRNEAMAIVVRLGPILEGRAARGWSVVAKRLNLPMDEAMALFDRGINRLRAMRQE